MNIFSIISHHLLIYSMSVRAFMAMHPSQTLTELLAVESYSASIVLGSKKLWISSWNDKIICSITGRE